MKTLIDKIAIGICGILIVSLILILFTGCGSIDPVARYKRDTKEYSYEYRMANNTSFSKANAKQAYRNAKKDIKADRKRNAKLDAIRRINEKTKEIKNEKSN